MAGTSLELPASDPYATHLAEWRNVELPRWQTEIEQWEAGDRRTQHRTAPTTANAHGTRRDVPLVV